MMLKEEIQTEEHEKYMQRCIDLARKGLGGTQSNPLVGSVIVCGGKVIGEGWHRKYGEAHAEVNAINNVKDKTLLKKSTLYVSLEPCSHHGKTPPCANLIIVMGIPKVVIGMKDPFEKVSGRGIALLQASNIDVEVGILEKECTELNKHFLKYVLNKRPYIYIKYAETNDGYIDYLRTDCTKPALKISSLSTNRIFHKKRTEVDAILIGYTTALLDNPKLNSRYYYGNNPLRIVIDPENCLSKNITLFKDELPLVVLNKHIEKQEGLKSWLRCNTKEPSEILKILYELNLCSILIEGGSKTQEMFIDAHFWDEAWIIQNIELSLYPDIGVKSPKIEGVLRKSENLTNNYIFNYENTKDC